MTKKHNRRRARVVAGQTDIPFRTWGGARRGAGRKPNGPKAGVPHVRRPEVRPSHPLHVTVRLADGLPSLREPVLLACVRGALNQGRERFGVRVVHYSVQSNHMHLIVEAAGRRGLASGMRGLGVRIAHRVNRVLARSGRIVGDRYHARALASPRSVRNALAYVLLNAARHRGSSFCLDPASSGMLFDGWAASPHGPPAWPPDAVGDIAGTVVAPALWLLRVGWRRRGLIEPSAVPKRAPPP